MMFWRTHISHFASLKNMFLFDAKEKKREKEKVVFVSSMNVHSEQKKQQMSRKDFDSAVARVDKMEISVADIIGKVRIEVALVFLVNFS